MSIPEDRHCPWCGRFVSPDAEGWYARLEPDNDSSEIRIFCSQEHQETYRDRHAAFSAALKIPADETL